MFHDFGVGFPSQDLDIWGVDCNKMLGAKVASIFPREILRTWEVNFPYFGTNGY